MDNAQLASLLFQAFTDDDEDTVRRICAPDLVAIQNNGPAMSLDVLLKFSLAVTRLTENFHYEDAVRSATQTGFVEEHTICTTLPDGNEFRMPACVVADVAGGKITELREYFDSAAATALADALKPTST
jgi:ketosteroid isomerase-like protein